MKTCLSLLLNLVFVLNSHADYLIYKKADGRVVSKSSSSACIEEYDFVEYNGEWKNEYFDSKLATYAELSELNSRDISFVTIRRRGTRVLGRLKDRPPSDRTPAVIDIPKRRHKRIRYVEETIQLDDYDGEI